MRSTELRSAERWARVAIVAFALAFNAAFNAACDVCFSACGTAIFESCWLPGGGLAPTSRAARDEIAPPSHRVPVANVAADTLR